MADETTRALPPPRSRLLRGRLGALVAFGLLFLPLFGLGLVWCLSNGADRAIADGLGQTPFQVVLKFGMRRAQADDLAALWRKKEAWSAVQTLAPYALLGEVDELSVWVGREENRDVLTLMPYVVELRLAPDADPRTIESLVADLEKPPEVDRVLYDSGAVAGLTRMHRAARTAGDVLTVLLLLFALGAGALLWMARSPVGWGAAAPCVSGLVAVVVLSVLYSAVRGAHPIAAGFFLSFTQSLILIALGAALGATAILGAWRGGSQVAASLVLLSIFVSVPGAHARNQSADDAALPGPAPEVSLGALPSREASDETVERLDARIEELKQLLDYHNQVLDWDRRDKAELERNAQLTRVRIDVLREELQSMRRGNEGRHDRLESVARALVRSYPHGAPAAAPGAVDRSRRRAAFYILAQTLKQDAFMADVDRSRLEEQTRDLAELLREQARLDFFRKNAGLSPEAIRAAKTKVRNEMVALIRQRALMRDEPAPLPPPEASPGDVATPAAPDRDRPVDEFIARRRMSRALGIPVVQQHSGHYLFAAPGSLIRAARSGTVLYAGAFRGLGHVVIIDHGDGVSTVYSYLTNELSVKPGQHVEAGEYIGSAGLVRRYGTGGVRFEVRRDGELTDLDALPGVRAQDLEHLLLGN